MRPIRRHVSLIARAKFLCILQQHIRNARATEVRAEETAEKAAEKAADAKTT